jgi:hypothetical protein
MSTAILDALNSLAQDIDIQVLPTGQTHVFDVKLLEPTSGKGPLSVGVSSEVVSIEELPVDLLWVSRAVSFAPDADIPLPPNPINLTNLGALPILPSLPTQPIPAGEPGSIGRISGTLPVARQSLETVDHPVTIELRWSILDENQVPLTGSESFGWKIGSDLSGHGGVIQPPPDRVADVVRVTLVPPFVDLGTGLPVLVPRWFQARFRLKASGVSTAWFELRQKVDLPAIGIPTLAFLFQGKLQEPPVLVLIPSNSPLGQESFMDLLLEVSATLDQLKGIVAFLGLFVDRVNDVNSRIQGANVKVKKADEIRDLNGVDLISHPNWPNVTNIPFNDTEAEDEISSLVFFGPPGRRLKCYNARNFSDSQGEMHVTVDHLMMAFINNLHTASPGAVPSTAVTVLKAPTGCRGFFCFASVVGGGHQITTFGDEFSSLKLA